MGTHDVENIEAGDELYIDGREATVDWALGGEFSVTYQNGGSRTIDEDEILKVIREEDLGNEQRTATFVPYFGMSYYEINHTSNQEFEEPMVAVRDTRQGIECVFNDTAMERGNLPQYDHVNLLVSSQPFIFAISPAIESATHSGSVELNYRRVDISKLAKELNFSEFFRRYGVGEHRWLKTQWDDENEMFIVDISCLRDDLIVDRKTNRK